MGGLRLSDRVSLNTCLQSNAQDEFDQDLWEVTKVRALGVDRSRPLGPPETLRMARIWHGGEEFPTPRRVRVTVMPCGYGEVMPR